MRNYDDIEADDLYDMAVAWIRGGNKAKAADCLKKAIELNSYFTYAYITLAAVLASEKKYSDAVHVLKRASRIDSNFDRLNFLMSRYAFKAGDYKTSLTQINRAIDIDPKPLYLEVRKLLLMKYSR